MKMASCLVPQGFPVRSGCIFYDAPQGSGKPWAANAQAYQVPPTSEFGFNGYFAASAAF